MSNSRKSKHESGKTVGFCTVCEQYISKGHYKFIKLDREPAIVCEWCEKRLDNGE